MARFQKPPEGTWTERYRSLGNGVRLVRGLGLSGVLRARAERLLQLLHSLLLVSYAVEVWRQPEVIHAGSARIDRTREPRP